MEEDVFINLQLKAEVDTEKERVGGRGIYLWVMHLSLIVRRNYAPPHV